MRFSSFAIYTFINDFSVNMND